MTLADVARAWGVAKQSASAALKRRGVVPAQFATAEEAVAWRLANVPQRTRVTPTPPGVPCPSVTPALPPPPAPPLPTVPPSPPTIPAGGDDFESRQLCAAEEVAVIANAQVKQALAEPAMAGVAVKNWGAAMREVASIREQFTKLQLERRDLLSLDDALEAVAVLLGSLRRRIVKLGERAATAANPVAPAVAKAAIDREVDMLLAEADSAASSTSLALKNGAPETDEDAPESPATAEGESA